MTKRLVIIGEEVRYVILEDGETYTIRYSDSDVWTELARGKKILTVVDTGNGLDLSEKIGKTINYADWEAYNILFQYIYNKDNESHVICSQ